MEEPYEHPLLESPEPIEGLKRFQIRATVEYAESEVKQIQELQRVRKAKETA